MRHVAEFDLVTCQLTEDIGDVLVRMQELDLDVIPVSDKDVIRGYIEKTSIETKDGPCSEHLRDFSWHELVSESTPLIDLFDILYDKQKIFVLDRNRITGIITHADLQKAPVRMWLFGLLTLLEMRLLELIRIYCPKGAWREHLTENRLEAAEDLLKDRRKRNEAIDLADCLQFCDKREIVLRNDEVRELIGLGRAEGERLLKDAEDLRNNLAHGQDIVKGKTWPAIIDLTNKIEALLERCDDVSERARRGESIEIECKKRSEGTC